MTPTEVITHETLRRLAVHYIFHLGIVSDCNDAVENAIRGYGNIQKAQRQLAIQATRLAKISQELCRQADELECEEVLIVKTGRHTYWGVKVDYGTTQVVSAFPVEILLEEVSPKLKGLKSGQGRASILDIVPKTLGD